MIVFRLFPVFISMLLISAHFFRSGSLLLAGISCAALLLLLLPKFWAARIVQGCLVLASLEWLGTLYSLVQERIALGAPWLRLAAILGCIAVFTAASAWILSLQPLKRRFIRTQKVLNGGSMV